MGLDNRDYIRNTQGQNVFGGGGAWPPVVKALLIINVVVFLAQVFLTAPYGQTSVVQQWLALSWDTLSRGQVWRLLTYSFCHSTAQFLHIVFNMLMLVIFGRQIEQKYGSREFLAFYLVAAIAGGTVYILMDVTMGPPGMVIGASAATLGILILFACNYPRQEVLVAFLFPLQVRWVVAFIIVGDLLGAIGGRGKVDGGVAVGAHLGGIAFAFIYWKFKMRLAPFLHKVSPVRTPSGGKKIQRNGSSPFAVTGRSKAEIDKQVDDLLQKISDKGFQSLSQKEKDFLQKASDKFGKK